MSSKHKFKTPGGANKYYRAKFIYNNTIGVVFQMWLDLAFKDRELIISGVEDKTIATYWHDVLTDLNVERLLPAFMTDMLVQGRFAAHMIRDEAKKRWTDIVPLDPDYYSVQLGGPTGTQIIIQASEESREWATSTDPRCVEQRADIDPNLLELMASGEPIPLDPKSTLFMARRIVPTDFYGTSVLAALEEEDYESAKRLVYKLQAYRNPLALKLRNELTTYIVYQKVILPIATEHGYPMPTIEWSKVGVKPYMEMQWEALETLGWPEYERKELAL